MKAASVTVQEMRASWFTSAEEACKVVDAIAAGGGGWSWITRQ
jgi:hypothetical protein